MARQRPLSCVLQEPRRADASLLLPSFYFPIISSSCRDREGEYEYRISYVCVYTKFLNNLILTCLPMAIPWTLSILNFSCEILNSKYSILRLQCPLFQLLTSSYTSIPPKPFSYFTEVSPPNSPRFSVAFCSYFPSSPAWTKRLLK